MNPWMIVLVVLIFGSGFGAGIKVESDHRDAGDLAGEKAASAAYHTGVLKAQALGVKLGEKRAKTKVIYQTIKGEADELAKKPEYAAICLPPDGVRVANEALGRRTGAGQRNGAVPGPDAAKGR